MAATPMAVLQDLREHLIKGKSVRVEGDDLVLADLNGDALKTFPKHTPTAYHSKNSPDKKYDMLAVYTCYAHAALTFSDYVLRCRTEKATVVSTVDKKDLIAFLKGDIETSPQILGEDGKPTASDAAKTTTSSGSKGDARANGSHRHEKKDAASESVKKRKLAHDAKEGDRHKDHKRVIKRILDRECTFRNRTTVLNASKKTFENVLKMIEVVNAETKEKIEKASKTSLLAPTSVVRKEQLPLSRMVKEKIPGTPIIVVPAGFSDLFTMLNVKDFLEDGVYIPNMQKKAEGCRKAQSIILQHEEEGETYTFKIVDSVARFRDKDWRCVVAVIASGQSWQFKGWKWNFPLEVFKKVCGIHIYNQGAQLSEEIKQWDVKILMVQDETAVHRERAHLNHQPGERRLKAGCGSVTTEEEEQASRADKKHVHNMPSSITNETGSNREANKQVNPISSSSSVPGSSANDGPAPVLKTVATLSNLTGSKSFNKVAPEDLVVAPPATPQQKVFAFLENNADTTIYNLLFVCFIFFSMELILGVYGRPNYFNRGLGFALYLDLVSTLSVIPDVDWIWSHVIGTTSSGSTSSSQTAALKAGRASRAGTKAGRIVRLFRMLRILRVLKKDKNAEVKTVEISEPSKIGKVLAEKTTRRLIILVLLIIIASLIIDGTVDLTQDDFQVSQLERLHRYTQDYNQSGEISEEHVKKMVEQYVRDCNGLIIEMHITNVDDAKLKEWLYGVKFQQLDSDETDWVASSSFSLDVNPKTGWTAAKYLVDDPEGAIGSKYKIDASYLSPNMNMAARLEAATGQFDVPMLLSEWFVDELSVEAWRFCRKIDRVAVKGSEIPMDLWTFDIGHYPTEGVPPIIIESKQMAVEFAVDPIYKTLQEGIPKAFFENFHEGIGAYFGSKWDHARQKLNAANQIWEDGPTKVVLKVMETESKGTFTAPSWWKGFRQLIEK
ncbi:Parafibromin-like protein, partial [Globisporangium splendens]